MFHITQTQRSVLGSIILALTMTFGSMSAHASLVSFNGFATPANFTAGDTTFDVTLFVNDAIIPATGTADVLLSSVDVIFNGPVTNNVNFLFTYTNTDTSPCVFICSGNHERFTAQFINGIFTGSLRGAQPGPSGPLPGGLGIARVSFFFNATGGTIIARFFDNALSKGNGETDTATFGAYTGPVAVSAVPLPAALPLFGSALAMLGIVGWRRKRRGDA